MTKPSFNPDDPRLTAFVLGELDDLEHAEIQNLISSSGDARQFVDDLRSTIDVLSDGLQAEPAPSLTEQQRAALAQAAGVPVVASGADVSGIREEPEEPASSSMSRRSLLSGLVATVVTMGIVVAVLPEISDRQVAMNSSHPDAAATGPGNGLESADGAAVAPGDTEANMEMAQAQVVDRGALQAEEEQSGFFGGERRRSSRISRGLEPSLAAEPAGITRKVTSGPEETDTDFLTPAADHEAGRNKQQNRPAPSDQPETPVNLSGLVVEGREAPVAAPGRASVGQAAPESGGYGRPDATVRQEMSERGRSQLTRLDSLAQQPTGERPASTAVSRSDGAVPKQVAATVVGREVLGESERLKKTGRSNRVSTGAPTAEHKRRVMVRGGRAAAVGLSESRRGEYSDFVEESVAAPGTETYQPIVENAFVVPDPRDREKRLSTVSVDVDTASYANVRRFLMQNQLPPPDAVRIEELVNYFRYDYPQPQGDEPFSVTTDVMLCPWKPGHRLARIGLQAKSIDASLRPPTNLVFLLDVSGSMRPANKLPLVQQAMRLLVEEMTEDDQIAIVTYASNAGLRLASTPGSKKTEILQAIDALRAGGSTNGEGGIRLAYDTAIRHFIQDGSNRVILCTDGDFNVGVSSDSELVELIQEKAASGVFLSVFGFGMGNLKDGKLEKLADHGNGHYGYVDSLQEARRAFKEGLVGTLYTVAKDVKLQVEFNPATVGAYRLIGYENRRLASADFTDDTKDAGEIGAGHTVTALYEIVPRQVLLEQRDSEASRYIDSITLPAEAPVVDGFEDELFFVRLRYKKPDEETSQPVEADFPVRDAAVSGDGLKTPDADFRFAAAVASFGMNLRGSQHRGNWDLRQVYDAAVQSRGEDADGRRTEFIDLVQRSLRILGQHPVVDPLDEDDPVTRPAELSPGEARIKATVDGKYRRLLKKIEVRDDLQQYGTFHDFGFWDAASEYKGHRDLLPGHWVYVYPHWYIWGEVTRESVKPPDVESGTEKPASEKSRPAEATENIGDSADGAE